MFDYFTADSKSPQLMFFMLSWPHCWSWFLFYFCL